ncbi:MAG: hypothetical protein Q9187_005832 [Circinaria calcarea]
MAEETVDDTVAVVPIAQELNTIPEPSNTQEPSNAPESTFTQEPINAPEPANTPILPQPTLPTLAPKLEPQDTPMADAVPSPGLQNLASASTPQYSASVSTPQPVRNATPVRSTNGIPEPVPLPLKAVPHGAPVRRYLNEKVTGVLLEGMKRLALEQYVMPEDPLRVLGEYLLQRSRELEFVQGAV